MSLGKTTAYVCDYTGEASTNEDDFYALKLNGQRKPRHVKKTAASDATFTDVMDKLIADEKQRQQEAAAKAANKEQETAKK